MAQPESRSGISPIESKETSENPFIRFVLKVHERCNLACKYCYMYELADQTWKDRAYMMPERTLRQAAVRIGEHAKAYNLTNIFVDLHGGEPLLIGTEGITKSAKILRENISPKTNIDFTVQTNGTLLTRSMLEVLRTNKIGVGVSLDGTKETNDSQRIYRDGRGSYDQVASGLQFLHSEFPDIYQGILCTVDVTSDPVATYESLLRFKPPGIDFLLPHGNWTNPPPEIPATRRFDRDPSEPTPYADWLIRAFDRWFDSPKMETDVRLFSSLLGLLLGKKSSTATVGGLLPTNVVVIESDGAIEQVDSLKSTYHGAAATGMNVFNHSFADVLQHPAIKAQQAGREALSHTCQNCRLLTTCGGGMYAHRWQQGATDLNNFKNPSIYCADLMKLIDHTRSHLEKALDQLPQSKQ